MENFTYGFKEIILNQSLQEKWKEIILNTGGTQSTLQDIKLPEKAGGCWYKDTSRFYTRNRFIYWRLTSDFVELSEASLDITLSGANVRLRPPSGSPALACWAHETPGSHVTIFFATVTSLHRIQLPHPDVLYSKMRQPNNNVFPSIFQEVSSVMINHSSNIHILSQHVFLGAVRNVRWACLPSGEAAAALVGAADGALLIKFSLSGAPVELPLKRDSSFLSTIAGALRGRPAGESDWGGVLDATPCIVAGMKILRGYCVCADGSIRSWGGDSGNEAPSVRRVLQTSMTRAALCPAGPMLLLYARSSTDCRVLLMRPDARDITILKTICAPQELELVEISGSWSGGEVWLGDDAIRGHEGGVWGLWSAANGHSLVLSHSFAAGTEWRGAWCAPESPEVPRLSSHAEYALHLTAPRLFPDRVLRKALAMCCHAAGGVGVAGTTLAGPEGITNEESGSEPLAEALAAAAEARCIRAAAQNRSAHDLMHRCWSEMYSWCIQYMEGLEKPLGLIVSENCPSGGSWCVCVRRGALGFIWSLPPLHSLLLADNTLSSSEECSMPDEGVRRLISVAGAVERAAAALEVESSLENEISPPTRELSPDKTVSLLSLRLREDVQFQIWVQEQLSRIPDLQRAVLVLDDILKLQASEVDLVDGEREILELNEYGDEIDEWDYLFSSELGVSLITEALDQMAAIRASVCRGTLVATALWGASGCGGGAGGATAVHLQAFSVLRWLHRAPCPPERRATQAQELLGVGARTLLGMAPVSGGKSVSNHRTVSGRWVGGAGGRRARIALRLAARSTPHCSPPLWHHLIDVYANCLGSMLWGVSDSFTFGWWLASVGEPRLVKKYVDLMEPWCEWNARSRQVILGLAQLELGDPKAALSAFCQAAPGVRSEPFLQALVTSDMTPARALVAYYLKVMKLFELQGASECVLQLAETAIGIAGRDDPNLPMLHSVVFRAALEWGGIEGTRKALAAAARHPAPAQRNSAAATLLTHLAQRGELSVLCTTGAGDGVGGVTAALAAAAARAAEVRARLADAVPHNPYYDFLYSLHMRAGRPRKAAACLYERATRCATLPASEKALRRRSRSLLTALHCLRLAPPKHAFILRPAPQDDSVSPEKTKSKRLSDGNSSQKNTSMIALGPDDLKRELDIVFAQLAFAQKSSQKVCPNDDPQSLGVELCAVGATGAALNLGFALSQSSKGSDSLNVAEAVTAMALSMLASHCLQHPHDSLNTRLRDASDEAPERAWRELRACVEKAAGKRPGSSHAHAPVTAKLLSMGAFLPHWLRSQHMQLNPGELIDLLLSSGRLDEAADACVEALYTATAAAGGVGGNAQYPPLSAIDNVLDELKCHVEEDDIYSEHHENLNKLIDEYIKVATRRSENVRQAKFNIFAKV